MQHTSSHDYKEQLKKKKPKHLHHSSTRAIDLATCCCWIAMRDYWSTERRKEFKVVWTPLWNPHFPWMIVHRKQIKIRHFTVLQGQTLFANFLTNTLVVPVLFPAKVLENIPDFLWQLPLTNGQQRSLASQRLPWEGLTCEPGLFFHLASSHHNALIVMGQPLAPGYHLAEALWGFEDICSPGIRTVSHGLLVFQQHRIMSASICLESPSATTWHASGGRLHHWELLNTTSNRVII